MEETTTQAVTSEAQAVIDAVSSGNVDKSVLEDLLRLAVSYIPTVILAVIIFLVGKLLVSLAMKAIDKAMGRMHVDSTAQSFLDSLIKIILTAFVIVITLSTLGIPMTSIITVIGASAVAVGLALQNSLSNVAGGFIILFTRPFSKGDYIGTNGTEGTVEDISILSTKLLTVDNKVIFIPNGNISSSVVINYSREEKRRVDLEFAVAADQDINAAIKTALDTMNTHKLVLKDGADAPFARISGMGDGSVKIAVRAWSKSADYWDVYFDLIEQIREGFVKKNIAAPRSQVAVCVTEKK